MQVDDLPQRIAEKIEPEPMSGCWLWTAAFFGAGRYGCVKWDGKVRCAHRVVYLLLVGPITDGLEVDHLCQNRACVNPYHLEAVPRVVNRLRRINDGGDVSRAKTQCPQGHPYDLYNVSVRPNGHRRCRTCENAARRVSRERKRVA